MPTRHSPKLPLEWSSFHSCREFSVRSWPRVPISAETQNAVGDITAKIRYDRVRVTSTSSSR